MVEMVFYKARLIEQVSITLLFLSLQPQRRVVPVLTTQMKEALSKL